MLTHTTRRQLVPQAKIAPAGDDARGNAACKCVVVDGCQQWRLTAVQQVSAQKGWLPDKSGQLCVSG